MKIFIYGTLKRGERNEAFLKNADYIGAAVTRDASYSMLVVDDPACEYRYPGVLTGGSSRIKGELYSVDDATLEALDRLEGLGEDYMRAEAILEGRQSAQIYLFINRAQFNVLENSPQIFYDVRNNSYEWKDNS